MASKISITEVGINQGLSQIKTGELFIVTNIDLDANKATLMNAEGDEKIVSRATLERWYRELTAEEIVTFGKLMKHLLDGGKTDDAVSESGKSETTEEANGGKDADYDVTDDENAEQSDNSETVSTEGENSEGNGELSEGTDADAEQPGGEHDGTPGTGDTEAGESDERNGGNAVGENGTESEDGVASPVTPSNAGSDKDKAKQPKKTAPKNAALMKVRQTIIDTILGDGDSIQLKKTSSYDVLKEKHNFAEITHGSNRFNVSVISKCLTEDQLNKVKVNPASFGWSIDADFTVFDESDIETAVQLIRQSREYRLANPVTRKKKGTK